MNYSIKTISTVLGIVLLAIITINHAFANSLPELYKRSGPEVGGRFNGGVSYRGQVEQPQLRYSENTVGTNESFASSAAPQLRSKIIHVTASDSNTPPPHLTDWDGKHYPPAEAFRREPGADLWHVKNAAPTANESHAVTLQQTLEHINAVPRGKELLTRLKAQMGQGQPLLFFAGGGWTPPGQGADIPRTVRPVNVADQPGSIAIEVNADYLQKNVRGQDVSVRSIPARDIRNLYMDLFRAEHLVDRVRQGKPADFNSYLNDQGIKDRHSTNERSRALHGYFTDELKVALAGDQFYGQLTASNHDGSTFTYLLNHALAKGGVPLAKLNWLSELLNPRVLHPAELIPDPTWASTYVDAIKSSNLSGGARLAFEPVKTGFSKSEWSTPLRVVLNTLDTRVEWSPLDSLNKALVELGQTRQIDRNSLILRDMVMYTLRDNGNLHELADAVANDTYFAIKVGREELTDRAIQALHQLVNVEKKYSPADVKDMAQGLQLPPKLQTFIDDLGNGLAPRSQSRSLPVEVGRKVAKLQVVVTN